MSFEVTSGIVHGATKIVVYGPEGIGKSTFLSNLPKPIFIDTEGSTKNLDVKRLPRPSSWQMLIDEIKDVMNKREYMTLVIDTADWAERLCVDSVCASHGKKGVEDFGYGNGYTYIAEEWGRFLNLLQDVIDIAHINVALSAHAIIRKFEQPNEMGAYDRYELKLGKKTTAQTAPLTKEWADIVLFANYKTFSVAVDDKGKKHKAQGGQRVMYTSHHPCWDAKNRHGLDEELPFDYAAIAQIFNAKLQIEPSKPLNMTDNVGSGPMIYEASPNVPVPQNPPIQTSQSNEYEGLPQALIDLMKENRVTEEQIRRAVSNKGYYPLDMPVKNYPQEFIQGVLIGAWPQVLEMINQLVLPFM